MKRRRLCAFFLALFFGMVSVVHAADCQKTAESCVEGPETRNIGGYPVHRDCWRYRSQFSCVSQAMTDDCQPLRDRGCSQIGSRCIDTNPLGACMLYEQTWQCRVASGSSSTITNCGGQQFCLDGHCFDTGNAPDADFAKMVTALEVQREAGKYVDPTTLVVFQGYDNRCRKKLFGLVNCCKGAGSNGSLFSNLNLILGAGGQVMGAVGSSYTFDALFASGGLNRMRKRMDPGAVNGGPLLGLNGIDASKGVLGQKAYRAGLFAHCKAIGWAVEEYGRAQISVNLTDYKVTPAHEVLDAARELASERGLVITGSEIDVKMDVNNTTSTNVPGKKNSR